jgi:hypothetical protein
VCEKKFLCWAEPVLLGFCGLFLVVFVFWVVFRLGLAHFSCCQKQCLKLRSSFKRRRSDSLMPSSTGVWLVDANTQKIFDKAQVE